MASCARFDKLPFAELFGPGIQYAREGFIVSPSVARQWANQIERFKSEPGFAEAFMPGGRAPLAGERFRFPAQARTLQQIADTQGESFYRGALAERIAAACAANGGAKEDHSALVRALERMAGHEIKSE